MTGHTHSRIACRLAVAGLTVCIPIAWAVGWIRGAARIIRRRPRRPVPVPGLPVDGVPLDGWEDRQLQRLADDLAAIPDTPTETRQPPRRNQSQ